MPQLSQDQSNESQTDKIVSLKDFIDEHQKTIAVIGVFVALALFWKVFTQEATPYISYLCLAITIPLLLEVYRGYDYYRSSWNLVVFVNLLSAIIALTGYHLLISNPDYLEKVFIILITLAAYLPALALINKLIQWLKTQDYEHRVRLANLMKKANVPIAERNKEVAKQNSEATTRDRIANAGGLLLALGTFFLAVNLATLAAKHARATIDLILDRTPQISVPQTK